MNKEFSRKLRKLNIVTHRDVGYFLSALIIIYCLSGIALNHIDDWNPDFIIVKKEIRVPPAEITPQQITAWSKLVNEKQYKVYDIPSPGKVKIYYDNASLLIDLHDGTGLYEKISRRPIFYHANVLHRNSLKGWKWVADIFGVMLILISITGLFILKGKNGLGGRGKWFVGAGFLLPVVALILFEIAQQ
ncbi:MAG: PepSY-associated TM helix domain-containing protein [Cyclobacteriaceae bacterium]|nr:PepSY-associated TM helix domain-containing protein [Cyclobacteriaceae bacterium]MCX7636512.1 PepSY-associated TM helix domain-containing protein [Cyclobacteriaceae bacterium]MDW8330544.1 PepSY-associated TM helix domain-containing protein [Cyclobacteriaceae bacterium]